MNKKESVSQTRELLSKVRELCDAETILSKGELENAIDARNYDLARAARSASVNWRKRYWNLVTDIEVAIDHHWGISEAMTDEFSKLQSFMTARGRGLRKRIAEEASLDIHDHIKHEK